MKIRYLRRPPALLAGCLLLASAVPGCAPKPSLVSPLPQEASGGSVPQQLFTEEAKARGIRFEPAYRGPRPMNIRQSLGCGVALCDFDGDGWLDLYFVGQKDLSPTGTGVFYRNLGNGRFEDRTNGSGLNPKGYWHGCAAGDIDNDGLPDLVLTGYGDCRLFRNLGKGRFKDITQAWNLSTPSPTAWATAACFADINRDGWLDLYIGRYLRFTPEDLALCDYQGVKASCGPKSYDPQRGSLYLNRAGSRFEEVTDQWGLGDQQGKTLGAAFCDADADGYPDLYLANDEVPGDLYRNLSGRRMENIGTASGTVGTEAGQPQGGMGVDWGDFNGDRRFDLFVTTFQFESNSLYQNLGGQVFEHASAKAGLRDVTRPFVAFGTRFLDYDNDGLLDLLAANGHIQDNVEAIDGSTTYRQKMLLLRNTGGARFEETGSKSGTVFARPLVGRGLATGDLDNDGDLDVVVTDLEGPPLLLMNRTPRGPHWLIVRLLGTRSNRMALGAQVTATAGKRSLVRECQTGGSYLSAGDSRVHFGLGADASVDLEVRWPSGKKSSLRRVAADRVVTLEEAP